MQQILNNPDRSRHLPNWMHEQWAYNFQSSGRVRRPMPNQAEELDLFTDPEFQ